MPAIPSKSTQVLAIAPKFALASDYVHFKLHGEYDVADTVEDDGGIIRDLSPVNGTDWASNSGWLTAQTINRGSGTSVTASAAERAFLRTDTLGGSILVNCWIQSPTTLVGRDHILSYGKATDADNWSFFLHVDGYVGLYYGAEGAKFATTVLTPGQLYNVGCVFDMVNSVATMWVNGVQDSTPFAITQLTALPVTDKFGWLLDANSSVGGNEWGEGNTITPLTQLISDIFIIRFETDQSAKFTEIMDGFYTSQRGTIPEILDGL